ncbi:fluoride efflux transporter CrcB [Luteibacter aegosomatissinici]|uniref:fluoride efflux transporter CrcB n=1 Tax=Luteibacter aegosomatissinici TaxID=2911539 RepID=UPI001FFB7E3D|nr:fluoride efflux transporter CrcB [Luteibacter aegosomatissinici]UPG95889.1 fluoride efflux transporter CrcB [Luteibacter aegosomatissinici]
MPLVLLALCIGATLGTFLRYGLAEAFNAILPTLPFGTLAANLLGGLIMGLAIATFMAYPQIPIPVRLGVTTGFLGGLTTFSTFSAESFLLLQRGQYGAVLVHTAAHVLGALGCVAIGFAIGRLIVR